MTAFGFFSAGNRGRLDTAFRDRLPTKGLAGVWSSRILAGLNTFLYMKWNDGASRLTLCKHLRHPDRRLRQLGIRSFTIVFKGVMIAPCILDHEEAV